MIVESAKLIFVHIPKTGGTTLEHYLSKKYGVPLPYNDGAVNNHSPQHCSYEEIRQILRAQKKNINAYRVIALVRNPFHRLISDLFCHHIVCPDTPPNEIHERVLDVFRKPAVVGDYHNWDNHFVPQHEFVLNRFGKIPSNMVIVDANNADKTLPSLGLDGYQRAQRHNTNPNRLAVNYDTFLPEETKDFVRQYYTRDFELFFDANTGRARKDVITVGANTNKIRRRMPRTVSARWG